MNRSERSWSGLVRDVGRSFLALVRAELEALAGDLQGSARTLLRALLVAAIAGAVVFWAIGLAIDVIVELLALVLPRWGAAATPAQRLPPSAAVIEKPAKPSPIQLRPRAEIAAQAIRAAPSQIALSSAARRVRRMRGGDRNRWRTG